MKITAAAGALLLCINTGSAYSWGDEGHEVIGLIADHYLEAAVRIKVSVILSDDPTRLTSTTRIDSEATWADKYRDSDRHTTKVRYNRTRNWHFVDLELQGADLKAACFGQPRLHGGILASEGPADDCVVDKINELRAELGNSRTNEQERRLALQYILHFVGDVHQPLHASDDHDQGGNAKIVTAPGIAANNLHHDWDTEFVARLGPDEATIARRLIADITDAQLVQWSAGTAADWAIESYGTARNHAYGLLPAPDGPNRYQLTQAYVSDAIKVTQEQLSKAGVRLAFLLNRALH